MQELEVLHGHLTPLWPLRESCCYRLGHVVLLGQLQAVPLRVAPETSQQQGQEGGQGLTPTGCWPKGPVLLPAQVRRGEPEEQQHHGSGVQLLLGCNLGCREHGHSCRDTNTLFCLLAFLTRYIRKTRAVREIKKKSFKDVLVPWKIFRSSVLNVIADLPAIMRFLARPEAHTKNQRIRLCSRGEELGKAQKKSQNAEALTK